MTKEFIEWHNKTYPNPGYRPLDPYSFIKKIDETHREIRDRLGGEAKDYEVKVDIGEKPISKVDNKEGLDFILNTLPNYLKEYNITVDHILKSKMISGKKVINTGKHILTYALRQKISTDSMAKLGVVLSSLGQAWAKNKNAHEIVHCRVSTTPYAFSLIGNMGCDPSSCFLHGSMNSDKKYCIAIHTNSFVFMISDNKIDETVPKFRVKLRGNGLFNEDMSRIHIMNVFGPLREHNHQCIKAFAKDVIGSDDLYLELYKELDLGRLTLSGGLNYYHSYGFVAKNKELGKFETEMIEMPMEYQQEYVELKSKINGSYSVKCDWSTR
jgi:hypothetical protein